MNPIQELKKLVRGGPAVTTGVIISVSADNIRVRTSRGVVVVPAQPGYKAGDSVLLRGGQVQGKVKSQAELPSYFV